MRISEPCASRPTPQGAAAEPDGGGAARQSRNEVQVRGPDEARSDAPPTTRTPTAPLLPQPTLPTRFPTAAARQPDGVGPHGTDARRGHVAVQGVVVRSLSRAFDRCEREDRTSPIDVELAVEQHRAYVRALARLVGQVHELPAAPEHPDCVFVEDTVVVLDDRHAVITRPGALSRRGEVAAMAAALGEHGVELQHMDAPATLDGGDALRAGSHLFVGLSARTNEAGASFLARAAAERGLETVAVAVNGGLHLKSACSLADEGTLLYDPEAGLDLSPFVAAGLECVAVQEPLGANVLYLGNGQVVVSAACPQTRALLERRGLQVTVLDVSELHKADGALTCPSVRLPTPRAWCT